MVPSGTDILPPIFFAGFYSDKLSIAVVDAVFVRSQQRRLARLEQAKCDQIYG
jgi:hypothetical protein